jgi:hypothetical protein
VDVGSHGGLSSHLKEHPHLLEKIRTEGAEHLPTGEQTDALFRRAAVHCTGKAGDVFLANYMTAHLIAPNTSPDIRYAVYFRLSGPRFEEGKSRQGGNVRSILTPWLHWDGLHSIVCGGGADAAAEEPEAMSIVATLSAMEALPVDQARGTLHDEKATGDIESKLASADYSFLQRQHSRQIEARLAGAGDVVQREKLDALESMFPDVGRETVVDVLHSCGGDAERAADHLLTMSAP